MRKTRIVLADDHTLMRIGLSSLIASEPDMTIVGEAENGRDAVDLACKLTPDLVIMDLMMPLLNGAEATRRIREKVPATRILVLTSYPRSPEMVQAVVSGADGALVKDTATDDLIATIRTIVSGKKAIPKSIQNFIRSESDLPKLTDRQVEILTSVTRGLTNPDIAKQFGISEIGVKKHLQVIFSKIGAATRAEAAAIALRKHLLKM